MEELAQAEERTLWEVRRLDARSEERNEDARAAWRLVLVALFVTPFVVLWAVLELRALWRAWREWRWRKRLAEEAREHLHREELALLVLRSVREPAPPPPDGFRSEGVAPGPVGLVPDPAKA